VVVVAIVVEVMVVVVVVVKVVVKVVVVRAGAVVKPNVISEVKCSWNPSAK
jgi:hypothetical protein